MSLAGPVFARWDNMVTSTLSGDPRAVGVCRKRKSCVFASCILVVMFKGLNAVFRVISSVSKNNQTKTHLCRSYRIVISYQMSIKMDRSYSSFLQTPAEVRPDTNDPRGAEESRAACMRCWDALQSREQEKASWWSTARRRPGGISTQLVLSCVGLTTTPPWRGRNRKAALPATAGHAEGRGSLCSKQPSSPDQFFHHLTITYRADPVVLWCGRA